MTGVQTCALPIYAGPGVGRGAVLRGLAGPRGTRRASQRQSQGRDEGLKFRRDARPEAAGSPGQQQDGPGRGRPGARSAREPAGPAGNRAMRGSLRRPVADRGRWDDRWRGGCAVATRHPAARRARPGRHLPRGRSSGCHSRRRLDRPGSRPRRPRSPPGAAPPAPGRRAGLRPVPPSPRIAALRRKAWPGSRGRVRRVRADRDSLETSFGTRPGRAGRGQDSRFAEVSQDPGNPVSTAARDT